MVPTTLRRIVVCAAAATWMLAVPGCVKQSDFDAKVLEAASQAEQAAKAEEKVAQLGKDLHALSREVERTRQAKTDAEGRIETLKQKNADLQEQVKTLSQAEEKVAQLQKDLDAAKSQLEKANQAKKDAEAKLKAIEQAVAAMQKQPAPTPGAPKK
jgi:chromosome segregation ATPase